MLLGAGVSEACQSIGRKIWSTHSEHHAMCCRLVHSMMLVITQGSAVLFRLNNLLRYL